MCDLRNTNINEISPEMAALALQPWKIVKVSPLHGYRLEVEFFDGTGGVLDLSAKMINEDFAPLRDEKMFNKAFIECCGISWPCGIDLKPEDVYSEVHGG